MIRPTAFLITCVACTVCMADPPASSYIFPEGGQRGTTVECRVGGLNLSAECGFRLLGSGIEAPATIRSMPTRVLVGPYHHNPIAQQAWDYPKDMAASIKVAADAPLGVRYWYATTAEGATQLRPFVVGDLPEVIEEEEQTALGRPQPVSLPVTINGRVYPRADLDEYVFEGKAGQHFSAEVTSQRLGHKLDAKLELRDAAGRVTAASDDGYGRDPLLFAEIPADGSYTLRIHDIALEGDSDYVYRLSLRVGPYVTHMFPAGGRRGSTIQARLYGSGLSGDGVADQVTVNLDALPAAADALGRAGNLSAVSGSVMSSLMLASAAQPAGAAPAPNASANAVSGTAAPKPALFERAGFYVAAGFQLSDLPETVEIEPDGDTPRIQRVAFPGVVNGQLARVGDTDEFVFAARKDQQLDFEFFGRRLGSPIVAVWSVLESQGQQLARQEGDTRLSFVAPADGDYTLRVHELHLQTHGGSEFIYRLVATAPQPDFRLVLERDNIGVLPGQNVKMKLNVVRSGGFAGDIQLAATDLPAGVTFSPSVIAGNQNQIELSFAAAKDAPIGVTQRALVIGAATVDGQRLLHTAEVPLDAAAGQPPVDSLAVTVAHPPLFTIETDEILTTANRGATYVQKFTIERQPGFDGEIVLGFADRQARYLQGASGPVVVVKPGEKELLYPVFFPEVMDLNRTARVLLMGTAKVTDRTSKTHYVTYTSKKQLAVRVSPSILTLATDRTLLEAKPGETIEVPLRVGRTPELVGPLTIAAVLPADAHGVTATPATVAENQETVTMALQFASDARLGTGDRVLFRATGQRGGHPVIAEASLEIQLEP